MITQVLHCPYCHGYEFAGQRLGVLGMSPNSLHQAMLIPEWGPTTFFLNGQAEPDAATLAGLEARGVYIERSPVTVFDQRMSALPSPLKSPAPLAFHATGIVPR